MDASVLTFGMSEERTRRLCRTGGVTQGQLKQAGIEQSIGSLSLECISQLPNYRDEVQAKALK